MNSNSPGASGRRASASLLSDDSGNAPPSARSRKLSNDSIDGTAVFRLAKAKGDGPGPKCRAAPSPPAALAEQSRQRPSQPSRLSSTSGLAVFQMSIERKCDRSGLG